jgi:hypothetical protein
LLAPLLIAGLMASAAGTVVADQPANDHFSRTWERTDRPLAEGAGQRTWMWGPEAVTGGLLEEYADSPGGTRLVQYYDKSRMEITDPDGDTGSPWYVTNGLLVVELATGRLQLGDATFEQRAPAEVAVAGDQGSQTVPTYATLGGLMDEPAYASGDVITSRLSANGSITTDESLAGLDVTAYYYVTETEHQVAEPFWYFLTSEQPVYEDGQIVSDRLFPEPFYATGLPIAEAYWVHTTVAGYETDILVQAFERRVLTYTPTNPAGWQVESGNVGQHYYQWRYGVGPDENAVMTTIPTGPDTIEYFAKGNPRPGELEWGPSAMSVAPDGSFWLADSVDARLVQFDRDGAKVGEIALADQYAKSIWDVEARTGPIWVWWANLDIGIYKIQAYQPDGTRIHDVDLDPGLIVDAISSGRDISVTDNNEVVMQLDLGFRYVRVVDSNGNADATPVDAMSFDGHTYRLEGSVEDLAHKTVVVDGREIIVSAEEGAFALEFGLIPDPEGDSFFIKRYSVFEDGAFHWGLAHVRIDGTLLGIGNAPEDDRYAFVEHPYSVGPDGSLYKLTLYREYLEITRIGFAAP